MKNEKYKKIILNNKNNTFIFYNIFYKCFLLNCIIFIALYFIKKYIKTQNFICKENYLNLQKRLKTKFYNKIINKIRIGIFTHSLRNGGIQRMSALLINYLYKTNIFNLYLFSQKNKQTEEFFIPNDIKRIFIPKNKFNNIFKEINRKKIDILIFQFPYDYAIHLLNNLKKIKIIYFQHYSLFYWIYRNYSCFNSIYKEYQNSKYIVSLVPFENDYLFEKWGIRSIFMNNFITFKYNYVIPSDLSAKDILMIGRSHDKFKRLDLGLLAMEYIINEIPDYEMIVICNITNNHNLRMISNILNLGNAIKFVGYTSIPEIYYRNSTLHIFPSISESFGLVLSEAKIYGIPSILVGLDYVSISKGGTYIIFDDKPETIAIEAIKILKDEEYKIKLANEARNNMLKYDNEILLEKWVKLILAIYNGDNYYEELRNKEKKLDKEFLINILTNQLKLLKMRDEQFKNITVDKFLNFTYLKSLNIKQF
jgi:hypothetical protein